MRRAILVASVAMLAGCLTGPPELATFEIAWEDSVTYPVCGTEAGSCQGGDTATHALDYRGEPQDVWVLLSPERLPARDAEMHVAVGLIRDCVTGCQKFDVVGSNTDSGDVEVNVEEVDPEPNDRIGVRVAPIPDPAYSGQEREFNVTGFVHTLTSR